MRSVSVRLGLFVVAVGCALSATSCSEKRASHARAAIRNEHSKSIAALVRSDMERHLMGAAHAAERLAPGFQVSEASRETQMRAALKYVHKPPKGVSELFSSPITFLAAVATDGRVIARDAVPDKMKGMNVAARYPVVRAALDGRRGYQIAEFDNPAKPSEPSVVVMFAAPASVEGKVVGALLLGFPLWRFAQRITKQLQLDLVKTQGLIVWAYLYRGDVLHHFGTPPDLDQLVPNAAARKAGLAHSAGGFTGEVAQFGRWYAYGVLPLRTSFPEENVGVIVFRSDPM